MTSTILGILFLIGNVLAADNPQRDFSKWEPQIQSFEQQDLDAAPAPGVVLFVGSSSIRFWDLPKYFPELDALNRGFGGSQIVDSIHFADRIILKYSPRATVFYAGDNDINAGKPPEQVERDFRHLVELVHKQLPETTIAFIAIKPSISRWKLSGQMKEANDLIADICRNNDRLSFIDIWAPMLGDDGRPRRELFVKDGLHLSHAGYQLWSKLVEPHVKE